MERKSRAAHGVAAKWSSHPRACSAALNRRLRAWSRLLEGWEPWSRTEEKVASVDSVQQLPGALGGILRLAQHHAGVLPACAHQLVVRSALDDPAVVQQQDQIGAAHRR